jgi:predicted nuclease of predicted toxin-antitoxin system
MLRFEKNSSNNTSSSQGNRRMLFPRDLLLPDLPCLLGSPLYCWCLQTAQLPNTNMSALSVQVLHLLA